MKNINYKQKLIQILYCIETNNGCIFDGRWENYGITKKEEEEILKIYNKQHNKIIDNRENKKKIALRLFKERVKQIEKYCHDTFGKKYCEKNLHLTELSFDNFDSDYNPYIKEDWES